MCLIRYTLISEGALIDQTLWYGGVGQKVNDAITSEQSDFSIIQQSKTFEVSCRFR